jgi:hypothetical protein
MRPRPRWTLNHAAVPDLGLLRADIRAEMMYCIKHECYCSIERFVVAYLEQAAIGSEVLPP